MTIRILSLALAVALAAGSVACREEGGAEKAGRQLDQAVEDLGDKADAAVDDAKDAVDDLKDQATE